MTYEVVTGGLVKADVGELRRASWTAGAGVRLIDRSDAGEIRSGKADAGEWGGAGRIAGAVDLPMAC